MTRLFEVFDLAPVLKPERRLSTINGDPSNIEWLIVMWQTSWDNKRLQRVREHFRQRNIDSLP